MSVKWCIVGRNARLGIFDTNDATGTAGREAVMPLDVHELHYSWHVTKGHNKVGAECKRTLIKGIVSRDTTSELLKLLDERYEKGTRVLWCARTRYNTKTKDVLEAEVNLGRKIIDKHDDGPTSLLPTLERTEAVG